MIFVNVGLLFVGIFAVLIYLDAERLRRERAQGQGPWNQSPIAWALGTVLLALVVIPLYIVKREAYQGIAPANRSFFAQLARAYLWVVAGLFLATVALAVIWFPMRLARDWAASKKDRDLAPAATTFVPDEGARERFLEEQRAARQRQEDGRRAEEAKQKEAARLELARIQAVEAELSVRENAAAVERQAIVDRAAARRRREELEQQAASERSQALADCRDSKEWRAKWSSRFVTLARRARAMTCSELAAEAGTLTSYSGQFPAAIQPRADRLAFLLGKLSRDCVSGALLRNVEITAAECDKVAASFQKFQDFCAANEVP